MRDRLLIVKLADIGDLVTATPAIEAAVDAGEDLAVLTTPHAAPLLNGLRERVEVIEFPKALFDRPRAAVYPASIGLGLRLALRLRRGRFSRVAILHHLTTAAGTAKYRALAAATGAHEVAGLDNGRGGFLTRPVVDAGFGAHSESEYSVRVVEALGVPRPAVVRPRTWPMTSAAARGAARARKLAGDRFVAVHAGTGVAAPARAIPTDTLATIVEGLRDRGLGLLLVGGSADRAATAALQAAVPTTLPELVGELSIDEMSGALAVGAGFVGADSGLLHVAAAAGVPCTALFGPTDPAAWAPVGDHVTVLRSPVACSPCLYQPGRPPLKIACAAPFCVAAIRPDLAIAAIAV